MSLPAASGSSSEAAAPIVSCSAEEIRQTLTSAGEAVKADAELLRWFLAATTESRSGDASFTCVDKPSESEVANAIQAFRTQLTERRAQLKQQEQQVLAQLEAVAHEVNGLQPLPHTQRGQLTKLVQSLAVLPETPTADAYSTSFWADASEVAPAAIDTLVEAELIERHPDAAQVKVRRNPLFSLPWDEKLGHLGSSSDAR